MGENKYQKGQIYKIVSPDFSKCYIGSTCEGLSKRMARHRYKYQDYMRGKQLRKYTSFQLFDEYGAENCKILLIIDYPCNSSKELRREEGYYIQNTDCINKHVAGRTKEEWNNENTEHTRQYKHTYYLNKTKHNKSQMMQCQCGATHTQSNKSRHEKSQKHQDWLKQQ